MAATDVEIANMALAHIGVTQAISALSDTTKEGVACNRFYAQVRNRLLKEIDWQFARRRDVLAEVVPTETHLDWSYAYTLPTAFLKARALGPRRGLASEQHYPFEVAPNAAGTASVLFCDFPPTATEEPVLTYTRSDLAVTLYPEEFVDALAWSLASHLVTPLRVDAKLSALVRQRAAYEVERAIAANLATSRPVPEPDAAYIRARS